MKSLVMCAALAACGGHRAAPVENRGPVASMDAARAAERGTSGPRDYAKAAEIYAALCNKGSGSIEACFALIDANLAARGTSRDLDEALALETALCTRGQPVGCYWKLVIAAQNPMAPRPSEDEATQLDAQLTAACARGDGRACTLIAMGGDGSAAEEDRREKYAVACKAGDMDACGRVLIELELCEDAADVEACERKRIADWRSEAPDLAAVADFLGSECTAGNALACDHIPSRRVPMSARCAAHDFSACAELACMGDDAAAAQAKAHGADTSRCNIAYRKARREWQRDPHRSPLEPIVTDGQGPIGARATPPWEAVRFQHHGGRDARGWPRFDIYNMNDHALTELTMCVYAFDDAGAQLARFEATLPAPVAPNALVPLSLGPTPPFPATTSDIVIDYPHVRFDGGPSVDDATRCPAQRPHDKQGAYMRW